MVSAIRRRARPRIAIALLASLLIAAAVGLVLYAASSVTFIASEPLSDPRFGPQNACALKELKDGRIGFAVGPDGAVAVYSGASLVLCNPGQNPRPRTFDLRGITSAALDFKGTLWVARRAEEQMELYMLKAERTALERVGDLSPIALVGHADGVIALESSGRLSSLAPDGAVLAVAQLPDAPTKKLELATNADGTLVALTTSGGVIVLDARTLTTLRAESPCEVQWAWWLERSDDLLLSCAPEGSFSLKLNARTGETEERQPQQLRQSVRVPLLGHYVEDCAGLPCSTRPPI